MRWCASGEFASNLGFVWDEICGARAYVHLSLLLTVEIRTQFLWYLIPLFYFLPLSFCTCHRLWHGMEQDFVDEA